MLEGDSEPQYPDLEAVHQIAERQAEDETSLLPTRPTIPVSMEGYDPEGATGNYSSPRINGWAQQPAIFEVSQAAASIDHVSQRMYEFSPIPGFNEQTMDLLSMNWMSPEQSASFGWDGFIAVPSYAANEKSDLHLPFFFSNSGALPDTSRQYVPRNDAQVPSTAQYATSLDNTSHQTCSPTKSGSEGVKSIAGSYYVDGDGSRAPFGGRNTRKWRRRRMTSVNDTSTPGSNITSYTDGEHGGLWEDTLVNVDSYESLIQQLHLELNKQSIRMDTSTLPSLECITHSVQSYFATFHSTFPFIRKTTFLEQSRKDWMLLLAVAVVGSKYTPIDEEEDRLHALSPELIAALDSMSISRLCHDRLMEAKTSSTPSYWESENGMLGLGALQAATLFLICSLHRGKPDVTRRSLLERHYLVGACKELKLLSGESEENYRHHDSNSVAQKWLINQSLIRVGLMIWVILEKPEIYLIL
jgi:hypothetical protein